MATEKTTVFKPLEALLGDGIGFPYQGKFRWYQRRGLQKHWLGKDCHHAWLFNGQISEAVCNN